MQEQKKSRKSLLVGIIAAVIVLGLLLALVLTQCVGGQTAAPSTQDETVPTEAELTGYTLYWNLDRTEYEGKSEGGMSSRAPQEDGYYHIRFLLDGQEVTLKTADRRLVNTIDTMDIMGLDFDEDGNISEVFSLDQLPLQKVGWEFFVQSFGGGVLKVNSGRKLNGMEILLELTDATGIYDMTGASGPVGCKAEPVKYDRVYAIADMNGKLTHVFLYERSGFMLDHAGECQHCKEEVVWQEWTKTDELPTETGHYQLQNDVVVSTQQMIQEDQKICLDLNGKLVTNKETTANYYRIYGTFNAGTSLALMDTSEEKTGTIKATGRADKGMCIWVRYGQFHMYGGTLDASQAESNYPGTAIAVEKAAFAYMYGGEIIGGLSKYFYSEETNTYSRGSAGSLYVVGKFVMYDGLIRDGRAEAVVTAWNEDGTPKTTQRGPGGNIFINTGGIMEMHGGTVRNGVAGTTGGNIWVNTGAELTISGGVISGGKATGKGANGGNLFINSGATVTMTGGTISNGICYNYAGNVYSNGNFAMYGGVITGGKCFDFKTKELKENFSARNVYIVDTTFTMAGGRIDGGLHCIDTNAEKQDTVLALSGSAKIFDENGGSHLTLSATAKGGICEVKVGKLYADAKIGVSSVQKPLFTQPTDQSNADRFVSGVKDAEILWMEEGLTLGRMQCVCGGKAEGVGDHACEEVLFAPWSTDNKLPTTTGNYYLVTDVTLNSHTEYKVEADVNIDMNGNNITMNATQNWHRVFRAYGTEDYKVSIGLTNSKTTGGAVKIDSTVDSGYGMMVWLTQKSHTFNLYDGVLDASSLIGVNGGVAVKLAAGTFNMYGGEVKGGYDNNTNTKSAVRGGGAVTVEKKACFNMYGGIISDGGTVSNGGNIMLKGTLNMYGGAITGGRADNVGGNIMAYAGSSLNISGGEIYGGYKWDGTTQNYTNRFANVYSYGGDVTLSGGTVSGLTFYKGEAEVPKLILSGNAVVNSYKGSVGLVLNNAVAEIDDSKIAFTGKIAMSTGGYITGKTKEAYTSSFISLSDGLTAVYLEERLFMGKLMCACGGKAVGVGGHQCEDVLWTAWTEESKLPNTAGNYYLTKDVTLSGSTEIKKAGTVNIDMNGFNITMNATKDYHRVFVVRDADNTNFTASVGLTNSNSEKGGVVTVKLQEGLTSGYGSIVWLNQPGHTFNLYAGILDGSAVVAGSGGAVVKLADGSRFNMYGGEIRGGTAKDRDAGAVYINAGAEFNLYNGTVSGGKTTQAGSTGRNGGNFYVAGTLNVAGGTISEGYAATNGGNIYVANGGKVEMTKGAVSDGFAGNVGGNIMTVKGSTLTVSGGTLSGGYKWDGTTKNYSTAFANVYSYGGDVTLSGGTVSGLAFYKGEAEVPKLILSGNATINANPANKGLTLKDTAVTIDDSKAAFTGSVAVSSTGFITGETNSKYAANFASTAEGMYTLHYQGKIYVGEESKIMCVCGGKAAGIGDHTCEDVLWKAWTEENSLPTSTGNYYLTKPVTLSGSAEFNTAATVNIDLAGYSITCASTNGDDRIFKIQGGTSGYKVTVGLTDSVGGGSVVRSHAGADNIKYGSIVWLADTNHTFNLYAGILDGSAVSSSNGGAVIKVSNGKFNMYGGEVKGGKDNNTNTSSSVRGGGAVTIESAGTFNLYKGTVSGGESVSNGGSFMVNGILNISGGTVTGGYAASQGGNVFVSGTGTLNVSGGLVENGYCGSVGGNVQVWNNGKLTISGGHIKGGYKWDGTTKNYTTRFANVYSYGGSVTLSGGTVSGIAVYKGDVSTSGLILSGSPTVDNYNGGIGLAVSGLTATIDDSNGTFAGNIAVSNEGRITGQTKQEYLSCFTSLVSGKSPAYKADGCIWIQ